MLKACLTDLSLCLRLKWENVSYKTLLTVSQLSIFLDFTKIQGYLVFSLYEKVKKNAYAVNNFKVSILANIVIRSWSQT